MSLTADGSGKRARKPRRDKKAPGRKMSLHLTVKMRPDDRKLLREQGIKAGYKSAAQYLRALATLDRQRIGEPYHDYNSGI